VFLAWSSEAAVEHWILQLGDKLESTVREHLGQALSHVRARGYSVNILSDHMRRVNQTLAELARHPLRAELRAKLVELIASLGNEYELLNAELDQEYDAALIAAPVFGADGSVVFAVTLSGLGKVSGRQVLDTAARLSATTLHLTRQIAGRLPAAMATQAS